MIIKTLKRIIKGSNYIEGYGEHPGTAPFIVLVILGLLIGGLVGGAIMFVLFGIPYSIGAYSRAKVSEEKNE